MEKEEITPNDGEIKTAEEAQAAIETEEIEGELDETVEESEDGDEESKDEDEE